MLNCISGVDYFEPDPKKAAKTGWTPHMEVVYHLWSFKNKASLVVKVILPRWKDDVAGEIPEVPSVSGVWSGSDWHEREVYDLSGVRFTGHPNLRRILCPEDWEGHPLRKDYEMPLEYHGIRGK
jgi:NADH-quinone oxidoreductase subunit C